jgi:hypothetical protein
MMKRPAVKRRFRLRKRRKFARAPVQAVNPIKNKIKGGVAEPPLMRWDLVNELLRGRGSYLEIGVASGECASHVVAQEKWGVDLNPRAGVHKSFTRTFRKSLDNFLRQLDPDKKFDVVLVDGLDLAAEAYRAILDVVTHLNQDGVVVVHNCNPKSEISKAIVALRARRPELNSFVIDADRGIGVVALLKKPRTRPIISVDDPFALTSADLPASRAKLLGLVAPSRRWQEIFASRTTFEVVTASFGSHELRPAAVQYCAALAFTDSSLPSGWQTKRVQYVDGDSAESRAFRVKMLVHNYSAADVTLWVDPRVEVISDPTDWALEMVRDHDVALLGVSRSIRGDRSEQLLRYESDGFPADGPSLSSVVVVRRMTPKVRQLGEAWFKEPGDLDLSLSYLLWKRGILSRVIPSDARLRQTLRPNIR